MCARFRISGLPVTDEAGQLVGIITNRDMRFEVDQNRRSSEVMTKAPLITAQEGVSAEAALGLLRRHKIEKLPIVDGHGQAHRPDHRQGLRQDRAAPATPPRTATAGCWSVPPWVSVTTPGPAR